MDLNDEKLASYLKKKLQNFLNELHQLGTVNGFKYFTCVVRGKEEILVSVKNTIERRDSYEACDWSNPPSRKQSIVYPSDSLTSSQLPYDKQALVLSQNSQLRLSGLQEKGIGLPPASPSGEEDGTNNDTTLFLIAGYGRYSCPYVWIRSNHERLFRLSYNPDSDRDSPLRLKSTHKWKDADVQVFEVVAELIRLCTYPAPRNPFEVDLDYFRPLSPAEQLLSTAAMIQCLQKIVINTPESKTYSGKVFEDLQRVSKLHFECLYGLIDEKKISTPTFNQDGLNKQPGKNRYPQPQIQNTETRYQPHQNYSQQNNSIPEQYTNTYPRFNSLQPSYPPPNGSFSVRPTQPVNATPTIYGSGPSGAFPGGFERLPAPSMF